MRIDMPISQVLEAIKENSDFLLAGHVRPDGDTLGCMKALGCILKSLGKEVTYVLPQELPFKYAFLFRNEEVLRWEDLKRCHQVLFALDVADEARLEAPFPISRAANLWVNIDHHEENTRFGHINLVVPGLSATGLILNDLAIQLGIKPTDAIAEAIFTAIVTDTGNYKWSSTDPQAHRVTADLMEAGLNTYTVVDRLENSRTISSVKLLGHALATLQVNETEEMAWIHITSEVIARTGAQSQEIEGITEIVRSIAPVEVALLFLQKGSGTKVSLRSKNFLDVNLIAREMGGGGHNRAAGCFVDRPIEEVMASVIARVSQALDQQRPNDHSETGGAAGIC
ncbi:MAG: hypothetical protein CVV64_02690 [Candidatus Wallbacteria bacterium HGW-Wallbacteria-1]|jgi:phosphoesterase RecJ-like protein|uniref:Uncharacterized protein n=1 Tax=Candidatus Wallbacteria bacterium HGW-Wallbacteria-1 TaxID=2013854 RepID=A0A2N1PTC9_9BACT|nr:MAG: hypothetical protein CVV64_02690 [Candidatus Wallbacteria bacterium HGW-Wallbacteria-1]